MSKSFRQYEALIRSAQDAHRLYSPAHQLIEQITKSSAFLTSHRSGFAEAVLEMQRQRELLEPTLGVQRMIAQMQASQQMANHLTRDYRSSIASLHEQADQWKSLVVPAIRQLHDLKAVSAHVTSLADSFVAWESSATRLAQRVNEIGLIAQRAQLAARLFAPSAVFTAFTNDTFAEIESAKNQRQAWALETSLQLAEEQLIATTDALGTAIAAPTDDDEVSETRELRSPYVQQIELLDAVEGADTEDAATLIDASPAASAVDLSRNILTMVVTCNEARKISGAEEIFKPTTKLLEVYTDMPWLMPVDKRSFSQFVDCLYFLFYEGAGKDKLRFLKSHGGPIADEDFDFILCVKHLRNKWTRHDADHGKDVAIRKAWAELAAKFQSLGLQHMPVTADDFRLIHVNLLSMAYEFIEKILCGVIEEEQA